MLTPTWIYDLAWSDRHHLDGVERSALWRTEDGLSARAYGSGDRPKAATALSCLVSIAGPSAQLKPSHHYVVEADVEPQHEADFNAWYAQEHLPGLASVPGVIRAMRFRRATGSPCYLACYDLTTPDTLKHAAWLAVRHTAWSDRVRPTFRNPRRTMFVLPPA